MRRVAALVAGLALAGCGGGTAEPEASAGAAGPPVVTRADPGPGQTLVRFVRAARRGDAAALWSLLSVPTRESGGPTLDQFRRGLARSLRAGPGTLEPGARVLLSRRVGSRFAVAALAGERIVDGEPEQLNYAAAFVSEDGAWRVELDAVVFGSLEPEPLDGVEARPQLRARAASGGSIEVLLLWLDGRAVPGEATADTPFQATAFARADRSLAPGRHDVVAFAATRDAAGAVAWPFHVSG